MGSDAMDETEKLEIRFLNAGQGDCTHVILPTGEHMLVDMNRDAKNRGIDVVRYLGDELPMRDSVQELDYLVNTHPHDDHIRGMGDLHDNFEIQELWHSGHERDLKKGENSEYDRFLEIIEDLGDQAKEVRASADPWAEIGDVACHVFRPSSYVRSDSGMTSDERREAIHDECMVLKIGYAGRSVMLTGDSSKAAWESIMKHYNRDGLLAADVLSASHHGSRTFFRRTEDDDVYRDHLDTVDPDAVVISVGADNPHGHPHDDALEEYEQDDPEIYRTDQDLTVVLTIEKDGKMSWEFNDEGFQDRYELERKDDDSDSGESQGGSRGFSVPRKSVTVIGGGRYA